ncbi:MAG: anti-sigma factor [Xenococcaceae cyanobacterium MO_207.B15]|nr:anti-sigma factor [Xenococcaceae cyanobacterium MO_207.B15]
MTNNSESHNLEEILAGYVLGNLDETELAWLNEQLVANPELREEVKQLQATLTLMPYDLPQDVPESNLRQAILNNVETKPSHQPRLQRLSWIIGAVTAFSTLCLGINNYGLRQQLASTNSQLQEHQELISLLRQPNNRLVSFQGLETFPTASGSLFIAPQKHKAVLALQNLQPLSGNQVYRLWAVSQEKKTGCANFIPDKEGKVHLELSNDDLSNANYLLITVEPEADTPQPEGNPIMKGYYSL